MALMLNILSDNDRQNDIRNTFQQPPSRNHPGIASIRESSEDGGRSSLIIAVESDVEDQTFKYCLQFIYTGT